MLKIAVTGGIACGKSLLGAFLSRRGAEVCEADQLAHDLMRAGLPARRELIRIFGRRILGPRGQVDRSRLGRRVFAKPSDLARLNAIMHPRVRRAWQRWIRDVRTTVPVAAVIIPLLFEVGAESEWEYVICVAARRDVQMRRLMARGLSVGDSERRIRAQLPLTEKMVRSDFVIINDGGRKVFMEQAAHVWRSMMENTKRRQ